MIDCWTLSYRFLELCGIKLLILSMVSQWVQVTVKRMYAVHFDSLSML